jgi:hypothetical protein
VREGAIRYAADVRQSDISWNARGPFRAGSLISGVGSDPGHHLDSCAGIRAEGAEVVVGAYESLDWTPRAADSCSCHWVCADSGVFAGSHGRAPVGVACHVHWYQLRDAPVPALGSPVNECWAMSGWATVAPDNGTVRHKLPSGGLRLAHERGSRPGSFERPPAPAGSLLLGTPSYGCA